MSNTIQILLPFSLILLSLPIPQLRSGLFFIHIMIVTATLYIIQTKLSHSNTDLITYFILVHLISINIITFLLYWYDKRASIKGKWRVAEKKIQAYIFIGGALAAYFASKILRHKTIKKSFKKDFYFLIIIQLILFLSIVYYANVML